MIVTHRRVTEPEAIHRRALWPAVLLVAGCSAAPPPDPTSPSTDDGFPVTLTSKYGKVTVNQKPQRIVSTFGYDHIGKLAIFGIAPVGADVRGSASPEEFFKSSPWLQGKVDPQVLRDDMFPDGPNLELIAGLKPDLILATPYNAQSHYRQLSEIAPTWVGSAEDPEMAWRDIVTELGTLLGEPENAKQAIAEADRKLALVREDLAGLQGKTYQAMWMDKDGGYNIVPQLGPVEFGMVPGDLVDDDPSQRRVSPENVDRLNADALFIWTLRGTEAMAQRLRADPRYRDLPAVRNNAVFFLDMTRNNSIRFFPASLDWAIENIVPELKKTAYVRGQR